MFVCDKCGEIDHVIMDGYLIGDRILEGVKFDVRKTDGKFEAKVQRSALPYLKRNHMDVEKWEEEMAAFCQDYDIAECPKCGWDVALDE